MGKRGPASGTGGRPRKSLDEKLLDGQTPKVLKAKASEKAQYPEPSDFLSSAQRIEIPLRADEVYKALRQIEWVDGYSGGLTLQVLCDIIE